MPIKSSCPTCGAYHYSDRADIGRTYVCAHCATECIVPSERIAPNSRFARYFVLHPLGIGSSSEVHLALDPQNHNRKVALKILFVEESDSEVDVRRFFREVRNASSLVHPGIVQIYETGQAEGLNFLAMEYVEGDTLETILDNHGALLERDGLAVVRDVAMAMAYAWNEKELVHRDIKPGNILLSYEGKTKVMDLGIAKSMLYDLTRLTDPDTVIGSPPYMSPEQCSPGKPIDFRADIYSLGATCYHLLTNEFPFLGQNSIETLKMHLFSKFPDPRRHCPTLREGTVQVMEKMMAKSSADRHASWEALIEEVNALIASAK